MISQLKRKAVQNDFPAAGWTAPSPREGRCQGDGPHVESPNCHCMGIITATISLPLREAKGELLSAQDDPCQPSSEEEGITARDNGELDADRADGQRNPVLSVRVSLPADNLTHSSGHLTSQQESRSHCWCLVGAQPGQVARGWEAGLSICPGRWSHLLTSELGGNLKLLKHLNNACCL